MKNITLPSGGKVESYTVYEAVNTRDSSDRFKVIADTELHAKIELLDKLGYRVEPGDMAYRLVDAETDEPKAVLQGATVDACVDQVLKAAHWRIQEPMNMVGGSLGSGYNEVEFDDE